MLEKHFTLDRTMTGPDHPFAIEPGGFRSCGGIRAIEQALGTGRLEGPSEAEARRCTLGPPEPDRGARHPGRNGDHPRGPVVKRPGFGIMPKHIDHVVGRQARVDIEEDDIITWEMV